MSLDLQQIQGGQQIFIAYELSVKCLRPSLPQALNPPIDHRYLQINLLASLNLLEITPCAILCELRAFARGIDFCWSPKRCRTPFQPPSFQ